MTQAKCLILFNLLDYLASLRLLSYQLQPFKAPSANSCVEFLGFFLALWVRYREYVDLQRSKRLHYIDHAKKGQYCWHYEPLVFLLCQCEEIHVLLRLNVSASWYRHRLPRFRGCQAGCHPSYLECLRKNRRLMNALWGFFQLQVNLVCCHNWVLPDSVVLLGRRERLVRIG